MSRLEDCDEASDSSSFSRAETHSNFGESAYLLRKIKQIRQNIPIDRRQLAEVAYQGGVFTEISLEVSLKWDDDLAQEMVSGECR